MAVITLFLSQAHPWVAVAALGLAGAVQAQSVQPKAGDPLQGLTPEQLELFEAGKKSYQFIFTAEDGLGPIFNKNSCASCHVNPLGGWGAITVTRFGFADKGSFDPMTDLGGSLLQVAAISPECMEVVPGGANITALRLTNSSMAFGMIEAIPDQDILANQDPNDANADQISGRARMVEPVEAPGTLRVGRFGWKAQVATVLTFSADAAHNEIGLTNRFFSLENAPNGNQKLLAQCDSVADPEDVPDQTGFDFVDRVTHFQRYLGPPPQTPKSGMSGEQVFVDVGCAQCHIPQWQTSNSPLVEEAIRNKTIRPYSDFLLHDMGLLADGIGDGDTDVQELRTPTLWNLRTRDPMLHDGRAAGGSFEERIAGQGGVIWWHAVVASEARNSGLAFFALPAPEKDKLVAFLASLGRREFDADGNGAIAFADFLNFKACYGGTGIHADLPCAIHDVDQDGDVDAVDFAAFLSQYEGANGDCDGDGITDLEEVLLGAADADQDGIPDTCLLCPADLVPSGTVDGADLGILLGAWGSPGADLTGDNTTDSADLGILLGAWGPCPN
jgi:hypothetical protein